MMSFIVFQIKYGWIAISSTYRGLCSLILPEYNDILVKKKLVATLNRKYVESIEFEKIDDVNECYFDSEAQYFLKKTREELLSYFDGKEVIFSVPVDLEGYTQFQKNVWKAVCKISYGYTCSYGYIAQCIGKPTASRAVGQALKRNPLPIIIPCHRVISSDGSIGGFSGENYWKEILLSLEKARTIRNEKITTFS